ncbi:hypothetical protein CDAR_275721 [Caerostris darwini]|uniref:Uncharacterized protein n=1 Tax=Caerostris darwini TaxID=1538125 RepID=A0AAV4NHM6_9ARAC|nr:hypothetical protein CDAR_275721 [Caerostris darwini]
MYTEKHFSELRNSEEETISLPVESSHQKTSAGSGKIPPQLPPTPYSKSIPPTPPSGPFNTSVLRFNARETIALSEESRSRDVIFDFAHHPSLS